MVWCVVVCTLGNYHYYEALLSNIYANSKIKLYV